MRHLLLVLVLAWLSGTTLAQTVSPANPTATTASSETLVFFNRKIATFRADLMGVSAHDRAKRAQARILDQLALTGDHRVDLKPDLLGTHIQIDGATSFVLTPSDLDTEREDTLQQVAQESVAALRQAIAERTESRSVETLLRALGLATAATFAAVILIWLGAKARGALVRHLVAATGKHTPQLSVGGMVLLHRDRLAYAVRLALILLYRLFVLVLLVEWLSFVLRCFPFTRSWGESLNTLLIDLAVRMLTTAAGAVPELLAAMLIFYLAHLATKASDRFFVNVQTAQVNLSWLDSDIAVPTQRIVRVVVWLFALAMAYPYLPGSQTEAFKGLSVLVGLMLSLGASSLIGQAASGLILTYGRVYRKGEYVRFADHEGTVTELGMFTTRIRTGLGEEITISNATILGGSTKNYSRAVKGIGFVLDTKVTIGYDTPWRQVHAMLTQAAMRTPGIVADPQPQVFQTALSDWYPEYRLVCQAIPSEPRPRALVLSALHANIQDVFNEYGVQIMSPQYFEDPAAPKLVPRANWYAAPATPPPGGQNSD